MYQFAICPHCLKEILVIQATQDYQAHYAVHSPLPMSHRIYTDQWHAAEYCNGSGKTIEKAEILAGKG